MERWHDKNSLSRKYRRSSASTNADYTFQDYRSSKSLRSGDGFTTRTPTEKLAGSVTINVGGRIYTIKRQLLTTRKNTLLESVARGKEKIPSCYKNEEGVYFFDRQPDVFHSVLQFYETGELHVPSNICSKILKRELRFWNIRDVRLEPCCWKLYNSRLNDMKCLNLIMAKCSMLDTEYSYLDPILLFGKMSSFRIKLRSIFAVMGDKDAFGKAYNVASIVITLLNFILTLSISALPGRYAHLETTRVYERKANFTMPEMLVLTKPIFMHLGIELLFTLLFVMDQLFRFVASSGTKRFMSKFLNLNDFACNIVSIAVLTFWFYLGYLPVHLENLSHFFRAMRVLRMLRHSRGLMMIIYTIQVRILDISFMLAIFFVLVVLFGSAMFISELCGADFRLNQFVNLPTSFFWAGTTLTAVGYGNLAPTSSFSYIIAVITALSSMYIMFLPIPLLAKQFCLYYDIAKVKTFRAPFLMLKMKRRNNII